MLIHTENRHIVEAGGIGDQDPASFGQHGVVGGVPRHVQRLGDPGYGQMLQHQRL